jgi:heme exporter protein D
MARPTEEQRMSGWNVFTWTVACAAAALLFLTIVSNELKRIEQRLELIRRRERRRANRRRSEAAATAQSEGQQDIAIQAETVRPSMPGLS